MFDILYAVAFFINNTWLLVSLFIYFFKRNGTKIPQLYKVVFHELRPFYLPTYGFVGLMFCLNSDNSLFAKIFYVVMGLLSWFICKDLDKDDRWKKRLEKGLGVVKSLGHRLTVVNEGA